MDDLTIEEMGTFLNESTLGDLMCIDSFLSKLQRLTIFGQFPETTVKLLSKLVEEKVGDWLNDMANNTTLKEKLDELPELQKAKFK